MKATKAAVGKFNKDTVYDDHLEQPKDIPELPTHSCFTEAIANMNEAEIADLKKSIANCEKSLKMPVSVAYKLISRL